MPGWINMPLDAKVGHIVLHVDRAHPSAKRGTAPNFQPADQVHLEMIVKMDTVVGLVVANLKKMLFNFCEDISIFMESYIREALYSDTVNKLQRQQESYRHDDLAFSVATG